MTADRAVRGVYASPQSVAHAPDYARRLADESGVNLFVLRAGFDPKRTDPALSAAAAIVRRCGARVCALVGTWWGHADDARAASLDAQLRTVCPWSDRSAAVAHERQWPVRAPGSACDERIAGALRRVIAAAAPDAVCLTHARFHHVADIAGLFEAPADGWAGFAELAELEEALRRADAGARAMTPAAALARSRGSDLPRYLDDLAGGGDVFARWFRARCDAVSRSLRRFAAAVKAAGPAVEFGQNAMNPFMGNLCGQDYGAMAGVCDFVQPLLGYSRWHVLQPALAWSDWLRSRVAGLRGDEALTVAKCLLGLGDVVWPEGDPERLRGDGEGPSSLVRETTRAALRLAAAAQSADLAVTPVLRGHDWPPQLTGELTAYAESLGLAGVIHQGCENLLPMAPPDAGWR